MTPQDYITNRLAELRDKRPDPACYPTLYASYSSVIEELEAMQAHLSQSTRPEVSIGGQYSVSVGETRCYLHNSSEFTVAQSHAWGDSGKEDLQYIADQLNQLEALRASHGELVDAITRLLSSATPNWRDNPTMASCWQHSRLIIDKAKSLQSATKTPTAAPQGQQ